MEIWVSELSKYMIAGLMLLYTLESFLAFSHAKERKNTLFYVRQWFYLFAIQFLAFFTMYFKQTDSKDLTYLMLYGVTQLLLILILSLTHLLYENCNRLLLNNMCMLLGIGIIILSRLATQKAIRQLLVIGFSFLAGLLLTVMVSRWDAIKRFGWLFASVGVFLLAVVLIMGNLTSGSKLSVTILNITFQPSEPVKILFLLFLAALLWENSSFKRVCVTTFVAAVHVLLLVAAKDLGSALIFFVTFLCVLFMATNNYLYFTAGLLAMAAASFCAYKVFRHVRVRVLAWWDPFSYIDKEGFQIAQSLFSIGAGGWFGLGLFSGAPEDIPYADTDFVFSAICEEMGIITGLCILLISISSFVMMMQIGIRTKDRFYSLISLGAAVTYIFQIFLTVGGGIKFIPLTGVTLPFISYGGSSILTSILLFYLIQGIYVRYRKEGGSCLEKA